MNSPQRPVVYDKGKYHLETVEQYGLPESHAYHHTVYFFRWLLEHNLMSDEFRTETQSFDPAADVTNNIALRLYEEWDTCLIDDMVSDEGNAFSQHYFDFDKGKYLSDYMGLLQGGLPSEFHILLTEENYQKLKPVIDRRFAEWKGLKNGTPTPGPGPSPCQGDSAKPKRWWEFWRN